MSEDSRGLSASAEHNEVGPDYFGFYTHEIMDLLLQDEGFLPFSSQTSDLAGRRPNIARNKSLTMHNYDFKKGSSFTALGSLFSDAIGAGFSDFKKERLKALLRQCVAALTQEVDEMVDPVVAMRQLQSYLRCKKGSSSNLAAPCDGDVGEPPCKKLKMSFSLSSINVPLGSSPISIEVNGEVNDDLQILLENDDSLVEGTMKKYSDELSATLRRMEQKLEELLDIVMSTCRSMTRAEKQQLQKLIQKLPPKNLDRVVEIIRQNKPSEKHSCDEILVDLEKKDDTTLWRLYYYIQTVDSARRFSV